MIRYHVLFVGLLAGTRAFTTLLSVANVRHAKRTMAARSDWIAEHLDVENPDRVLVYDRMATGVVLLRAWMLVLWILLFLYSGVLADVVAWFEATGWPFLVRGTAFFLLVTLTREVLGTPFAAFRTFVVDQPFGFDRRSVGEWLRSTATGAGVGLAMTVVLAPVLLLVVRTFPAVWWLAALPLYVAYKLAMQVVYPWLAALFNEYEPLPEGDLRAGITDLCEEAGLSCSDVYVVDASERSGRTGAYFVGFGPAKRVVLYDTLLERMDRREVESVLAHELAHRDRRHTPKRIVGSAVRVGLLLFALGALLSSGLVYEMFGLPPGTEYAGVLVAGLWVYPLSQLTAPLENRLSLTHEHEADAYAAEALGGTDALTSALAKLMSDNLSNPFPHPTYAAFYYSHPPIPERIRHVEERFGATG